MENKENKTWLVQLDLLRLIAAFSVVLLHASAHLWYYLPVRGTDFIITNAINVFSRFGVPVFTMISGVLFLDPQKEISTIKLWKNNILRLAIVYAIWSCIYGAVHFTALEGDARSIKALIKCMLAGNYHLWFLPMLMGLYALVPILRKWLSACDKKDLHYFLGLFVCFQILRITLSTYVKNPEVLALLGNAKIDLVCGYAGYFLFGYYLFYVKLPEKWAKLLGFGFPLFYLLNVLVSMLQAWQFGEPRAEISDSYGLFTFLMTLSLFQLAVHRKEREKKAFTQTLIRFLAKSTFGTYLVHLLVMESPWILPLFSKMTPVIAISAITVISFVISMLLASLLRKIPWVGRYLC